MREITLTFAQPGEIEPEGGNSFPGQRPVNIDHGVEVLGTGKAMGKNGVSRWFFISWQIQTSSQLFPLFILERQFQEMHFLLSRHCSHRFTVVVAPENVVPGNPTVLSFPSEQAKALRGQVFR